MRLRYTASALFLGVFLGSATLALATGPGTGADDPVMLQEQEREQQRSEVRVDGRPCDPPGSGPAQRR
ncbi:MAG: hypothetical protein HKN80_06840 [Acidimicrobiia bacterium]|nr:hypothetical protein [Acidimicrobiia bacterium]